MGGVGKKKKIKQQSFQQTKEDRPNAKNGNSKAEASPPTANPDNPFGGEKMMHMVKYLMSLNDESEIRDTIKFYLNDSPQVRNFADGFLVRKDFDHENLARKPRKRAGRK